MRAATPPKWPWVSIIVATVCLLLALMPASLIEHLTGDRDAILQGELWRLWTGHLVHFSRTHALIDSATMLVIGTIAESQFGSRRTALSLLVGAPLISAGMLLASPSLLTYRGASAMVVMLAVAVGLALWRSRPASRAILGTLAICLVVKFGIDASGMSVTLTDLPDHVRVAWQGHLLAGVFGGLWHFAHAGTHQVKKKAIETQGGLCWLGD
jgi:rhomboid family GlyGly-CTERM serine protease